MLDGLNKIEISELKGGLDKLPPCFLEVKNELLLGCGYWYPPSGKAPSMVASVYSLDKIYEGQKIELLKTVLEEAEIRDVTGYHPYRFKGQQTWTHVKDMTKLLYERDDDGYVFPWMLEMYYYDKSEEWIVYVSHEGTITFAGEKLAQISKKVIPDCYIYSI